MSEMAPTATHIILKVDGASKRQRVGELDGLTDTKHGLILSPFRLRM